ncbi:MAG: endoribonuclease [Gemmatimonadetes bacterium]|nr:endoribonuclease [Gemmatimonadota bacterium]
MISPATRTAIVLTVAALVVPIAAARSQTPKAEFVGTGATAPLSQYVRVGETIYLSGMLGSTAEGLVPGGVAPETRQALTNIKAALEKSGTTMDDIVKCTVFLADMAEWGAMNEVYTTFFPKNKPARSAVGVNGLARSARVEVECVAVRGAGGR